MKLETGNEIFDHISDFRAGSIILVLDETRFESLLFLNSLFSKLLKSSKITIISGQEIETPFHMEKISFDDLASVTRLSLALSEIRRNQGNEGILIHHYLPHVLMEESETNVLRMIEHWLATISDTDVIEVITLPQGTFPLFEKKLTSLASGVIVIKLGEGEEGRLLSFHILRACKPEHHLQEFPFIIREGRLLMKWGEEFTDQLPKEEAREIQKKVDYLQKNLFSILVAKGRATPYGMSLYERWLLTQIVGQRLESIQLYFPERFKEIMRKLASWNIRGIVEFVKTDAKAPKEKGSREPSLLTRIKLALPASISLKFILGRHRRIPFRAYHALRSSVESFVSTAPLSIDLSKLPEKVAEIEEYFQEMTARRVAVEMLREQGEDPRMKLDLRYLPKIVSLTLGYGYGLKPKIATKSPSDFEVTIKDCFICSEIGRSDEPACKLLEGTLSGSCATVFKERFSCEEVKCKAMGDDACVFLLKKL